LIGAGAVGLRGLRREGVPRRVTAPERNADAEVSDPRDSTT
jgi:hypothetical protein